MSELDLRKQVLLELHKNLINYIEEISNKDSSLNRAINKAQNENYWFTKENSISAIKAIASMINEESIERCILENYIYLNSKPTKNIGLILPGNIPAVGFQDIVHVFLSGNVAYVKKSSSDSVLIEFIVNEIIKININNSSKFLFIDSLPSNVDAIIATGSNNTSRYFDYYFNKTLSIIKKNRNSVAILNGKESIDELVHLADDIFKYFGLGCRNVSKIYVPEGYNFNTFIQAMKVYTYYSKHKAYNDNYLYLKSLYKLNSKMFLDADFFILQENDNLNSPLAQINFEYYNNVDDLKLNLNILKEHIQCIVSEDTLHFSDSLKFGSTQIPKLNDFADGINTFKFLNKV